MKVLLLRLSLTIAITPTYHMRGKEKALPAHINAIIKQYKSPQLSQSFLIRLQDSIVVKERAVNNNHPNITRAFLE